MYMFSPILFIMKRTGHGTGYRSGRPWLKCSMGSNVDCTMLGLLSTSLTMVSPSSVWKFRITSTYSINGHKDAGVINTIHKFHLTIRRVTLQW